MKIIFHYNLIQFPITLKWQTIILLYLCVHYSILCSNFFLVYVFSFRLGAYFTLVHSWCWIPPIWSFSLAWICSESIRYHPQLHSLLSLLSVFILSCYSYRWIIYLQCIIDLNENVLRVGGGEVSVPFLHGWFSNLEICNNEFFSNNMRVAWLVFNSFLYRLYINIYIELLVVMFRERHTSSVSRWGKVCQGSFRLWWSSKYTFNYNLFLRQLSWNCNALISF